MQMHVYPTKLLGPGQRYWRSGGNALIFPAGLSNSSIVVDFGGYLGEWSLNCLKSARPQIYIFEPVKRFYTELVEIFSDYQSVEIHNFAVSNSNHQAIFYLSEAASGINAVSSSSEEVQFRTPDNFDFLLSAIDVMKINIEGGEYELLEALTERDLIKNCRTIFIQFHQQDDVDVRIYQEILLKTHTMSWGFEYVWERWDSRDE